jgi:hypothetical protein
VNHSFTIRVDYQLPTENNQIKSIYLIGPETKIRKTKKINRHKMGNQHGGPPKNEAVARRLAEYKKGRKQKGAGVAVLKLDSCRLTDVDLDAVSSPPPSSNNLPTPRCSAPWCALAVVRAMNR